MNTELDIVCPFTAGNPEKTSFIWKRGNILIEAMNGEHLIIKHIPKSDKGWYTCNVYNRMEITGCEAKEGVSESSFYLDVHCIFNTYSATL
ncbi:hypothetical protein DPMN_140316 [Dreissena polymorpha]|uniref:Ig-like domain-containing protein n=1 Tax=Dreissena polymorpha TaxID=45954 RepID=A0A9D4G7D6_DREPO|nr:hypothetical protein DPMN_140316 [Dreissena polymorpha]